MDVHNPWISQTNMKEQQKENRISGFDSIYSLTGVSIFYVEFFIQSFRTHKLIFESARRCTVLVISLSPLNFLQEIRIMIKIESNTCYPRIYETFKQEWGKKFFFFNFEYWNFVVSKKVNFSNPPILNIFSPKFQEMVLG